MATRKARISKSDFVRSMANTPAQAVVAAAKKKGLKISDRYVYAVRSKDKSGAKKPTRKGAQRAVRQSSAGLDAQLRQAIAQLGLVRSREIFSEVERAFSG